MKKMITFLSFVLLFSTSVLAEQKCFLAEENNKIIKQEGDCQTPYSPESSFKIPLSLMAYDSGIFENETHPEWPYKKNYDAFINVCKSPHNPRTWMRDSCAWYSQVLTEKMGMEKFQAYIKKFNYGNQNLSGDKGKNNGLTHAWLSSSLEISPEEQIAFLKKLVENKLPVSAKAHELTKKILFKEELSGGWKLYGKTGNGRQLNADKTKKLDIQHGWFVGWIEKDGRVVLFANHIADDKKQDTFASFRAKNEAVTKLWYVINDLEK